MTSRRRETDTRPRPTAFERVWVCSTCHGREIEEVPADERGRPEQLVGTLPSVFVGDVPQRPCRNAACSGTAASYGLRVHRHAAGDKQA